MLNPNLARAAVAALLLPALAACSSSAAPVAQPASAAASTTPTAAATTPTPTPAPATTPKPNPATAAACRAFDTGTKNLAALTAQIATGKLSTNPLPAITIGKADIAIRAAAATVPASPGIGTDMVTLATDLETLSKKITAGIDTGHVSIGDEYAAVTHDWAIINDDCKENGYTLTNVIK